ncbi:hypothetical protein Daesc_010337 [Daldinia eschscholtzii]|uniref:Mitochondrial inner membrane protease subunit 2 n=1 Tax=Daldinia eschscholtzii TaxID=292717 RepID=A0AAX6M859_9PEZI
MKPIWARIKRDHQRAGRFGYRLFAFATWIPVVSMFNHYVGELAWISGPSMYPFLNAEKDQTTRNDVVIKYKFNAPYGLRRGMIVTFWCAIDDLVSRWQVLRPHSADSGSRNPYDPEVEAVKRIVGLEGDIIRTRSPYPSPTVRVPMGHVWVEGDGGKRLSRDSNDYGPISTNLITGKVTHIVWPLHRFGRVQWWDYAGNIRN